jgi:hypothetical protein
VDIVNSGSCRAKGVSEMLNFEERRKKLKLTAIELARRIFIEGMESNGGRNPYSVADMRSYCTFAAGVSDR